MSRSFRVVAVGGGHGLAATLRALRLVTEEITAVVSVADDGGSSGRLRELLPIVPPGDLRKCLLALADPASPSVAPFEYRFSDEQIDGHSLGNLILAGLLDDPRGTVAAIDEAARMLGITGRVLPATIEPVQLKAQLPEGDVAGQVAVMASSEIREVSLVPVDAEAPGEALEAIAAAEMIVMGPGSLFTSVLAALVVPDIRSAIVASGAKKVFVANLRPQEPETRGFDVGMHVAALRTHGVPVDIVVCDTSGLPLGTVDCPVIDTALARPGGLAHDPQKLAPVLAGLMD